MSWKLIRLNLLYEKKGISLSILLISSKSKNKETGEPEILVCKDADYTKELAYLKEKVDDFLLSLKYPNLKIPKSKMP